MTSRRHLSVNCKVNHYSAVWWRLGSAGIAGASETSYADSDLRGPVGSPWGRIGELLYESPAVLTDSLLQRNAARAGIAVSIARCDLSWTSSPHGNS